MLRTPQGSERGSCQHAPDRGDTVQQWQGKELKGTYAVFPFVALEGAGIVAIGAREETAVPASRAVAPAIVDDHPIANRTTRTSIPNITNSTAFKSCAHHADPVARRAGGVLQERRVSRVVSRHLAPSLRTTHHVRVSRCGRVASSNIGSFRT